MQRNSSLSPATKSGCECLPSGRQFQLNKEQNYRADDRHDEAGRVNAEPGSGLENKRPISPATIKPPIPVDSVIEDLRLSALIVRSVRRATSPLLSGPGRCGRGSGILESVRRATARNESLSNPERGSPTLPVDARRRRDGDR